MEGITVDEGDLELGGEGETNGGFAAVENKSCRG